MTHLVGPEAGRYLAAWLLQRGAPSALASLRSLLLRLCQHLRAWALAPCSSVRRHAGLAAQQAARALAAVFRLLNQSKLGRLFQSQLLKVAALSWRLPLPVADAAEAGHCRGSGRTVGIWIPVFAHWCVQPPPLRSLPGAAHEPTDPSAPAPANTGWSFP